MNDRYPLKHNEAIHITDGDERRGERSKKWIFTYRNPPPFFTILSRGWRRHSNVSVTKSEKQNEPALSRGGKKVVALVGIPRYYKKC